MSMRLRNAEAREHWVRGMLQQIPAGQSILDVGAGECIYKKYCDHLDYLAQDLAHYDGKGNAKGLQTKTWNFNRLDFVCDLYDIPEDRQYDAVLCTEVLEHVVDPVRAIEKMAGLVKPGGQLLIASPFCSLTHFAPYHYATGFSEYFYRYHLERLGYRMDVVEPNGGYFDFIDQELGRITKIQRNYARWFPSPLTFVVFQTVRLVARLIAACDGPRYQRRSSELLTFGWHIRAIRPVS